MDHVHDHAAMASTTSSVMNHDHHMMEQMSDTNSMSTGHGVHNMKDMMMMAVSIRLCFHE